jgi:hypothetical protein
MTIARFSLENKLRPPWTSTGSELGVLSPRCHPPQVPPCPREDDDPCASVRNPGGVTRQSVFPEDKRNDRRWLLIFALCLFAAVRSSELAGAVTHKSNSQPTAPATSAKTLTVTLPDQYFRLLEAGASRIEQHLAAHPKADLQTLEARDESWRLLSHAALVGAVLYAKHGPANRSYQRPQMLSLATSVGDLLADQSEREQFEARLNSDRGRIRVAGNLSVVEIQARS